MTEDLHLESVSETLFLPVYALALESQSKHPIIVDPEAVALTKKLNEVFRDSDRPLYRRLTRGKLPKTLVATLSMRIRRYDAYVRSFLDRVLEPVIVNLGCGLDDRRRRVDNGAMRWYDLDLPEVIALRRRFLPESDRFQFIGASVLDFEWLDQLPRVPGQRVLFVAEGLLMYLPEDAVQALVLELRERYPESELVAEVANTFIVRLMRRGPGRSKFRRQFGLSSNVVYQFGIGDSRDLEKWAPGLRLLDDWTYFDEPEPKLGWTRLFSRWTLFRRAQWTVHYRLGRS